MSDTAPDDHAYTFRSFEETHPRGERGAIPIPPYPNVKDVIVQYLKRAFSNYSLSREVKILTDHPSEALIDTTAHPDGSRSLNHVHGVSIVQTSGSVMTKGLGNVVEGMDNDHKDYARRVLGKYGWIERSHIEISYWSTDSRDRDYGADLVRLLMLEALESKYFLDRGILTFELDSFSDRADEKFTSNAVLYYGEAVFSVSRIVTGSLIQPAIQTFINQINITSTDIDDSGLVHPPIPYPPGGPTGEREPPSTTSIHPVTTGNYNESATSAIFQTKGVITGSGPTEIPSFYTISPSDGICIEGG